MTYYTMPVRSSAAQARWNAEADAHERKRAAAEATARQREQAQRQTQELEAANTAARTAEAQIAALRVELEEQYDVRREAMVEFVLKELANVERSLKRKSEELQRWFETKLAALEHRVIPGPRGDKGECGPIGPPGPSGPQGEQGPPGKLPVAEAWVPETVFYAGDVVAYDGGTFQARRDTGQPPTHADWTCLATPGRDGRGITVRGTWTEAAEYHQNDLVAYNGGSWVALRDAPGSCPGPGWQLVASRGKTGAAGLKGERGERGAKGDPGPSAQAISGWHIDRERYVATPVMSDGSVGPALELRDLFQQFYNEVQS